MEPTFTLNSRYLHEFFTERLLGRFETMRGWDRQTVIRGLLIAAAMLLAALFAPAVHGDVHTDTPQMPHSLPAEDETILGYCFHFDGVVNNGDGTSTWTYTVDDCGATKKLHWWVLELCTGHTVVSSDPRGSVRTIGGIYGIVWDVDIWPSDPPQTFTFTLSEQYAVTVVQVAARVPPDTAIGSLDGPACATLTPTPTPTHTPTPTPTNTPTATPTPTPTNAPPSVNAVGIYQPDRVTPVTAMDPQAEYAVRVSVSDPDGLANLQWVRAVVLLDADGDDDPSDVPASGDAQTAAVLTWTNGPTPSWSISAGSPTTWSLVTANCAQPDLSGTSGTWWFHFRPGKVAAESTDWDAWAAARDGGAAEASLYDGSDYDMNWYGEVHVNTPSVNWGVVLLGSDYAANPRTGISVTYIANGAYQQQVRTSNPWGSAPRWIALNETGTPGPGQFSMKANCADNLAGAVVVRSSAYTTIGAGTRTPEGGAEVATNALWLRLGPSGIPDTTYAGTIYYRIAP